MAKKYKFRLKGPILNLDWKSTLGKTKNLWIFNDRQLHDLAAIEVKRKVVAAGSDLGLIATVEDE